VPPVIGGLLALMLSLLLITITQAMLELDVVSRPSSFYAVFTGRYLVVGFTELTVAVASSADESSNRKRSIGSSSSSSFSTLVR